MPKPKRQITDIFQFIAMRNQNPNVCWPWNGMFIKERPIFKVEGVNHNAYRLVYELVHGEESLAPDDIVRHKCDNGAYPVGCCNPHHLELGTHQDNMDDMVARDRAGLPQRTRREILAAITRGKSTQQEIAEIYGVSRSYVSGIATGRIKVLPKETEDAS